MGSKQKISVWIKSLVMNLLVYFYSISKGPSGKSSFCFSIRVTPSKPIFRKNIEYPEWKKKHPSRPWTREAESTHGEGRASWEVKVEFILSFVPSRRVESDRTAESFPSSPDPLTTPSRTSPLPPLPPYPPPEHSSRDGSGKSSADTALLFFLSEWRTGITRRVSVRSVGRGIRLFPESGSATISGWMEIYRAVFSLRGVLVSLFCFHELCTDF